MPDFTMPAEPNPFSKGGRARSLMASLYLALLHDRPEDEPTVAVMHALSVHPYIQSVLDYGRKLTPPGIGGRGVLDTPSIT